MRTSTDATMTSSCMCRFCGGVLNPIIVKSPWGKSYTVGHKDCECEGAKEERNRLADIERERQEAIKRNVIHGAMEQAGISERYWNARHDHAGDFCDKLKSRSIYISGVVGCGKTYLATAIVKKWIEQGGRAIITNPLKIQEAVKATYSNRETETDALRPFRNTGLLVIDDIGKGNITDWAISEMFAIVDERYQRMKPVIVTSQYTLSQLEDRLAKSGDRETAQAIVSRLREMCLSVAMDGKDRRLAC